MGSKLTDRLMVLGDTVSSLSTEKKILTGYEKLDWMREHLVIEDKDSGKIIPATNYHAEQIDLLKTIIEMETTGIPPRIIVLKSRQIGISTGADHYIFATAYLEAGQNNVIVSHKKESSEYLFNIPVTLYDHLPREMQIPVDYRTRGLLKFSAPHRSAIRVGTAEDKQLFSSERVHRAHLSELAKWQSPKKPYIAIMQCVPNTSGSLVLIEFTAVDTGLLAQQIWDAANSQEGSDYRAKFYSWKEHRRYNIPLALNEKLRLTPVEIEYQQKHNLSDAQAKWMQYTKRTKCHNDMNFFCQEYPNTPEEAWIARGQTFFNRERLNEWLNIKTGTVKEPTFKGNMEWEEKDYQHYAKVANMEEGPLSIWEYPEPGRQYVIGGDISEGVGQDWTVVHVWKVPGGTKSIDPYPVQVASLRSNFLDTDDAALQIFMLGLFYNVALVGVERNGPGLSTLKFLERGFPGMPWTDGGYPNLYYHIQEDRINPIETDRLGWSTGPTSKKVMLAGLKARINKGELVLRSKHTVLELRGFAYDYDKKKYIQSYENPITRKPNDDEVVAASVTDQMLDYHMRNRFFEEVKTWE